MKSPQPLTNFTQKVELFAAKGINYHQTYARWRIRRLTNQWQAAPQLPVGRALASKLTLDQPALAHVAAAYAQGNVDAAQTALQAHFRTRTSPRFFFGRAAVNDNVDADIDQLAALVERVDAEGMAQTIRIADQICANTFRFRSVPPVQFAEQIDWQHTPAGNTDWRWDLNRHVYFESLGRAYGYTGDERYATKFCALLRDWLANNPARASHPNWSSVFEVAFRINTWLWAAHLFQDAATLDAETHARLLAGLWLHANFLDTHLELHARNNHLLLEAKSLAMAGLLLPEFKAAARWRERGLAIFCRELGEQVCADGVHGERASLYHRIISGEVLELATLAERNGVTLPAHVRDTLGKMAEFECWITKPDGHVSLVGDSAREDVHLRFSGASGGAVFTQRPDLKRIAPALREREIWLLGGERIQRYLDAPDAPIEVGSRAFAEGGYFVQRYGDGAASYYALLDCGPFGYTHDATHGHADALNIEIAAHGQNWLVDPGVYSTHLGWSWRQFFRGTAAHNTVMVDGQDQSQLLDGRRVYHPAQSMLHRWVTHASFDYVAGAHNGYARLADPVMHRRQLFFAKEAGYWVVVDDLTGEDEHTFELHFHFAAGLEVQLDPCTHAAFATNAQGASLQLVPVHDPINDPVDGGQSSVELIQGATEPIQGWVSEHSGEKRPAPVVRYHRKVKAPTRFCTVIYPQAANAPAHPIQAQQLAVTTEAAHAVQGMLALRIDTGNSIDYLLLAAGSAGIRKRFGDFESDSELFYLRQSVRESVRESVQESVHASQGNGHLLMVEENL